MRGARDARGGILRRAPARPHLARRPEHAREGSLNLDWHRLKAVVIESDDWGLCAWSPDEHAWRVLDDTPAFRTAAGRRYGGSTLEHAEDVAKVAALLGEFRGGDGFPPVLQANTILAAPKWERLRPPLFETAELPLSVPAASSPRWARPGLDEAVDAARAAGLWWPELHGLHHLPEQAWLTALRRGAADARRALEQHSPVCEAVEASGEYDPSEPRDLRRRNLRLAAEWFQARFGRAPSSLCAPDYRWDDALEADAGELGITMFQGVAERAGQAFAKARRFTLQHRWPNRRGDRFYLPPRIAFEPSAWGPGEHAERVDDARKRVRQAWSRGMPAVVSTHRLNYAHLRPERPEAGRAALRDLVARLVEDGATFLTDAEVRALEDRAWCVREFNARTSIVRYYGVPGEPVRLPAPATAKRASIDGARGDAAALDVGDGRLEARLNVGEYRIDWT